MKVNLKDKDIPRNTNGDPEFKTLNEMSDVFTGEEIVELVNRCLYQLEYQKNSHQKRQQEEREMLQPVKDALKHLYPGISWAKASDEQITKAMIYVKKLKEVDNAH